MKKPDYGVDAPGVVRNLFVIGALLLAAGPRLPPTLRPLERSCVITGSVLLVEASLMLLYAKRGKFRQRDRMLAAVDWKGSERVLDVGTGRGLLAIGAARKLTTGRAVGIDVWSAKDLSGNALERTRENAELEGVADRVELKSEDARRLTFDDASFDVVLSNLCLHNIPGWTGRAEACREIARVLAPGGVALLSDFKSTGLYARTLCEAGLRVERGAPAFLDTFPPLRVVRAEKPVRVVTESS
jgi:arsenite methyltransferase